MCKQVEQGDMEQQSQKIQKKVDCVQMTVLCANDTVSMR